jgi:hypothetical protein
MSIYEAAYKQHKEHKKFNREEIYDGKDDDDKEL